MGHFEVGLNLPNMMEGVPEEVPPVGIINNGDSIVVERDSHPFVFNVLDDDGTTVLDEEEHLPRGVTVTEVEAPEPEVEVEVEVEEGGEDE